MNDCVLLCAFVYACHMCVHLYMRVTFVCICIWRVTCVCMCMYVCVSHMCMWCKHARSLFGAGEGLFLVGALSN